MRVNKISSVMPTVRHKKPVDRVIFLGNQPTTINKLNKEQPDKK